MRELTESKWYETWKWKLSFVSLSWFIAGMLVWTTGEIYVRLSRPYITPDTRREASLEYEVALFCRHVFPKEKKRVLVRGRQNDFQKKTVAINERGYRGKLFVVPSRST